MKIISILVDKNENILKKYKANGKYGFYVEFVCKDTPTDYSENDNLTSNEKKETFKYYKTEISRFLFWKKVFHYYKLI